MKKEIIKFAGKYHYSDCKFPTEDQAVCNCPNNLKPNKDMTTPKENLSKKRIPNCQECQFENGEHSQECSHYVEPEMPKLEDWEKEFICWFNLIDGEANGGLSDEEWTKKYGDKALKDLLIKKIRQLLATEEDRIRKDAELDDIRPEWIEDKIEQARQETLKECLEIINHSIDKTDAYGEINKKLNETKP